jgi:ABC-type lipoprotein export system ATPase subunit
MPSANIVKTVEIQRSPRVHQLEGIFDLAPSAKSESRWSVSLPLEVRPWNVGLIVGPSGSGKTTLAHQLFGKELIAGFDWPADQSIVDGFPPELGIKELTQLLSSVGFSSPPAWLRPFRCLSNGEQFRVTIARALAENRDLVVIDEFTSVVDRTVAQIGSAAISKTVRKRGQKFIAVSCHFDIIDWLQPDWIFEPATSSFAWRSLQGRPPLTLEIARVLPSAWLLFKHHHYLTGKLHKAAVCFVAFIDRRPVAFDSWLPFVGRLKDDRKAMRTHRLVCLPDFQGVGIGDALLNHDASMWAGLGYRAFISTSHPAVIARRRAQEEWKLTRRAGMSPADGNRASDRRMSWFNKSRAKTRLTSSFEYVGPGMDRQEARRLLGK